MNYQEFLTQVIDTGIEVAKADYTDPEQAHKLQGSIDGFEACRGKSPSELAALLKNAHRHTMELYGRDGEAALKEYWAAVCFRSEVEWTCNVVSSALMNSGLATIVPPTARGVLHAAKILGVQGYVSFDEAMADIQKMAEQQGTLTQIVTSTTTNSPTSL